MEWVEVRGKTVEVAVAAALQELGIESVENAEVEVIQEPEKGFLGFGGQGAVVRVKQKPRSSRRRRSRRGGRSGKGSSSSEASSGSGRSGGSQKGGSGGGSRSGSKGTSSSERRSGPKPAGGGREDSKSSGSSKNSRSGGSQSRSSGGRSGGTPPSREKDQTKTREGAKVAEDVDIDQQREIVHEFLDGLVGAFGLEGTVVSSVDGDVIIADVTGEQTEALVGEKGSVLQAILELTRTVVQRKSQAGARIRLDIAGYNARRREALTIYARRLAEKVVEEGGEVMLEPMNAAERKVVHDAVVEIEGVRTFSEGEDPYRSVIIAPE